MLKNMIIGAASLAVAGSVFASTPSFAEDTLYIPSLSYRTGPFAGAGTPIANGFADYFTMLNERDGGIGGAKIVLEECETAYNAQKGVECYESTKGNGALAYNPYSTGITLQLIPKAPVDQIPVLSMGYGLSAAAVGESSLGLSTIQHLTGAKCLPFFSTLTRMVALRVRKLALST